MLKLSTLRERLRALIAVGGDPSRLAMAFAIGVFIAFSPLLGIHFLLALALVGLFRFNLVAMMAGVFVNNPWTFVPIYAGSLWLGLQVWPMPDNLPPVVITGVGLSDLLGQLRPYLIPFLVGTHLAGALSAVAAYFLLKRTILAYRRRRHGRGD